MTSDRVLVVDDNPTNLKLIEVVLATAGYEVHTATDAESAVEAVASARPDLIMMDLQLPGIDGLELTRRLKADPATKGIVVVATTAYAMAGDELKAREAGCDGYVAKPIDTRTLPDVVARQLNGARATGVAATQRS